MSLKRMPSTTLFQEATKRAKPNEISFIIHKLGFTASVESYQIISTMDSDMGQLVAEIKMILGGGELAVFNLYLCNSTALLQNPHLFIGKTLLKDESFAMIVEFSEKDTVQETFEVVPYFDADSNNHIVVEYYYDKPAYQQMYCSKLMPVKREKNKRMKMRQFVQPTPRARSTPIMQAPGQEPLGIPRGLTNSGTDCFINSAVQCLVQIPDLVNSLANLPSFETLAETVRAREGLDVQQVNEEIIRKRAARMVCEALHKLLQRLTDINNRSQPVSPSELRTTFNLYHYLDPSSQHDTTEFTGQLLEAIREVLPTTITRIFDFTCQNTPVCKICNSQTSVVPNANFTMLNLPLDNQTNLQSVIRNCFTEENEDRQCEACGRMTPNQSTIQFITLPQVLILYFMRYRSDGQKNNTAVNYPLQLNLNEHVVNGAADTEYQLFGVQRHLGENTSSGHYITFALTSNDDTWYQLNDVQCQEIRDTQRLQVRDAFVLYYKRQANIVL